MGQECHCKGGRGGTSQGGDPVPLSWWGMPVGHQQSPSPPPPRGGSRASEGSLGLLTLAEGPVIRLLPTQVTWLGNNGS